MAGWFLSVSCLIICLPGVRLTATFPAEEDLYAGSTFYLQCGSDVPEGEQIVQFVKAGVYLKPFQGHVISQKGDTYVISNNSQVTPTFKEQGKGRYVVTLLNQNTGLYQLDVEELEPQDSGLYGCRVLSKDGEVMFQQFRNFTIVGGPSNVTWLQQSDDDDSYVEIPDNDGNPLTYPHLNITEGQLLKVKCVVKYPTKMPKIQVLITNHATSAIIEEVTKYFTPEYDTRMERFGTTDGFVNSLFGVSYVSQDNTGFHPNFTHDGTMLVCKASAVGDNLFNTTVLNVHYMPKILCGDVLYISEDNGKLNCVVYSNPRAEILWSYATNNSIIGTRDGLTISNTQEDNQNKWLSSLTGPTDGQTVYTIRASNDLGSTYTNLTLESSSAAALKSLSFGLMLVLTLLWCN